MGVKQIIVARTSAEMGPGPYAVAIQAGHHPLTADEPPRLGGGDTGPAPFELVLSALAACTLITLAMYANGKQWRLDTAKVELKYLKDVDGGGTLIERDVTLLGELDETARARLADVAERTPVTLALKAGVQIRTRFRSE